MRPISSTRIETSVGIPVESRVFAHRRRRSSDVPVRNRPMVRCGLKARRSCTNPKAASEPATLSCRAASSGRFPVNPTQRTLGEPRFGKNPGGPRPISKGLRAHTAAVRDSMIGLTESVRISPRKLSVRWTDSDRASLRPGGSRLSSSCRSYGPARASSRLRVRLRRRPGWSLSWAIRQRIPELAEPPVPAHQNVQRVDRVRRTWVGDEEDPRPADRPGLQAQLCPLADPAGITEVAAVGDGIRGSRRCGGGFAGASLGAPAAIVGGASSEAPLVGRFTTSGRSSALVASQPAALSEARPVDGRPEPVPG